IVTPSNHNVVIIITGKAGSHYGYEDQHLPDGRFDYYGEGQVGDMEMVRGNKAIRDHAMLGKDLLLFESLGKGRDLIFLGSFICESWRWDSRPIATMICAKPLSSNLETSRTLLKPSMMNNPSPLWIWLLC